MREDDDITQWEKRQLGVFSDCGSRHGEPYQKSSLQMLARMAKTQAPIFTKIIPPKTPIKKATHEESIPRVALRSKPGICQIRLFLLLIVLRFREKTFAAWRFSADLPTVLLFCT
jgi:hypothetical protein